MKQKSFTLIPSFILGATLGIASPNIKAESDMAVLQFCQKIQERSTQIQKTPENAATTTLSVNTEAPRISPEYIGSVMKRIQDMARTMHFWDTHCPQEEHTTWEMGLTYDAVSHMKLGRDEFEQQLGDKNSAFYRKLFRSYVQFMTGAYGEYSVRSSYPIVDEQAKRKRFFQAKDEIKKIDNLVAQSTQSYGDGIISLYRLFQVEGKAYIPTAE